MTGVLDNLTDLVDESLLEFNEHEQESTHRGRLIQGNFEFAKDPQLNKTPRFLGGIGLSVNGLPEIILQESTIVTLESGDYATFTELEVVVLTSARTRRFFVEIENKRKLACGTNQDGRNAKGWSGILCSGCQYFPKNVQNPKDDPICKASVTVLVYIPSLDHTTLLELRGASYMAATKWLGQVATLSKKYAERPEVQAKHPGLARVNSYFFKTTLAASEFRKSDDNNHFQELKFSEAGAPYQWDHLMNSTEVIQKARNVLNEMQGYWKQNFIEHNSTALLALPSPATEPAALPPAGTVVDVPAGSALPVAQQPVTQPQPQARQAPQVSTIQLDDVPAAAVQAPQDDEIMTF